MKSADAYMVLKPWKVLAISVAIMALRDLRRGPGDAGDGPAGTDSSAVNKRRAIQERRRDYESAVRFFDDTEIDPDRFERDLPSLMSKNYLGMIRAGINAA